MSHYNIRDVQPHKWAGTGKFMTSLPATEGRNIGVGVLLDASSRLFDGSRHLFLTIHSICAQGERNVFEHGIYEPDFRVYVKPNQTNASCSRFSPRFHANPMKNFISNAFACIPSTQLPMLELPPSFTLQYFTAPSTSAAGRVCTSDPSHITLDTYDTIIDVCSRLQISWTRDGSGHGPHQGLVCRRSELETAK
jgi:hypothetical protein